MRRLRFLFAIALRVLPGFLLLVFLPLANVRAFAATQSADQSNANSQKSSPPSGQISGHVYRADTGAPLAKVVVTLDGRSDEDGSTSLSLVTGPDGSFAFAGLTSGKYILSAERCGFIQQMLSGFGSNGQEGSVFISLSSGQKRDGLDFRMIQGGVISGVVTDEDGEAVPGLLVSAEVYSYSPGGGRSENPASTESARTDDRGNFRVVELNPGSYFVKVEKDQSRGISSGNILYRETFYPDAYSIRDAQEIRVPAGGETSGIHIAVRLQRAFSIKGKVNGPCQDEDRSFCILSATSADGPAREQYSRIGTGENGSYSLSGFFSGEYQVTATARRMNQRGFVGSGSVRVQLLDRDAEADISIAPLGEVYGVASKESSTPLNLRHLKIALSPVKSAEFGSGTVDFTADDDSEGAPVDANGHFDVTDIHSGRYIFSLELNLDRDLSKSSSENDNAGSEDTDSMYLKEVICSGHDYARQPLDVGSGTRLGECKIKIGRDTGAISGMVLDGDKPVAGLIVIAIPQSRELRQIPRYTMTGQTNRAGQFTISGVVPGDYFVFAVSNDEERSYFSLDFPEKNQHDAVS
ncbi:MAG: carboxypeptidase-like regulatory domain-containing protein, partial [Candidatus Acidiferrales bacterium]